MEENTKSQTTNNTRKVNTFDFIDATNVRIPSKMKCTCCGKEVGGYSKEVAKRIKRDYGNSWERYQKEFKCFECNNAESIKLKQERNAEKIAERIEKAIKLLESNGYAIRKAVAAKQNIDNDIVTIKE